MPYFQWAQDNKGPGCPILPFSFRGTRVENAPEGGLNRPLRINDRVFSIVVLNLKPVATRSYSPPGRLHDDGLFGKPAVAVEGKDQVNRLAG